MHAQKIETSIVQISHDKPLCKKLYCTLHARLMQPFKDHSMIKKPPILRARHVFQYYDPSKKEKNILKRYENSIDACANKLDADMSYKGFENILLKYVCSIRGKQASDCFIVIFACAVLNQLPLRFFKKSLLMSELKKNFPYFKVPQTLKKIDVSVYDPIDMIGGKHLSRQKSIESELITVVDDFKKGCTHGHDVMAVIEKNSLSASLEALHWDANLKKYFDQMRMAKPERVYIFNLSWWYDIFCSFEYSSDKSDESEKIDSIEKTLAAFEYMTKFKTLIVISAGNDREVHGSRDIFDEHDKKLFFDCCIKINSDPTRKGLILLAGGVSVGNPMFLEKYSAYAGLMSRWFLSAPVMKGYSGTSFSAPLVSLAFAMLCAAFPKFSLREVLKLMYVSAALPLRAHKTDLHDWLKITNMPYKSIKAMPVQLYYGGGAINVARAYEVGKMIQDLEERVESLFVKDIEAQFSRKIQKTSWIGLKLEEFFDFKPNPKKFLKNMMNGLDKKEKYWGDKRRVLKKFVTDFGDKIDAFFKTEPLENNLKIASYYQNMRAFRKIYMPKTKVLKRKSEQL